MQLKNLMVVLMTTWSLSAFADDLTKGFAEPPINAKPQVWWHWNNGNVSKAGISADLESMAAAGLGGAHIFDVDSGTPAGKVVFNSAEWHELVIYAHEEAKRLGLQLTIYNGGGYTSSGGPWVTPEDSMKFYAWTETFVRGGKRFKGAISRPHDQYGYYRDIAVVAVRRPVGESHLTDQQGVREKYYRRDDDTRMYEIELPAPQSADTISFSLDSQSLWHTDARVKVEAQDASGKYFTVTNFRSRVCNLGSIDRMPRIFQIPETKSSMWRVSFGFDDKFCADRSRLAAVDLGKFVRIVHLGPKTMHSPCEVKSYQNEKSDCPASMLSRREDVIVLTEAMKGDVLEWDVPEGDWTILRFAELAAGLTCFPSTAGCHGFEVDKFDREALRRHMEAYLGKFKKYVDTETDPDVRTGLVTTLIDSYEVGGQTWSRTLPAAFKRDNGYDIIGQMMPALTGRIIESTAATDKFLSEFRSTVWGLFRRNYATAFTEIAHEMGFLTTIETYGGAPAPNFTFGGDCDFPMAEFWLFPNMIFDSFSVTGVVAQARKHNKKIIQAEAFSSQPRVDNWAQPISDYKMQGDRMFAEGINRMVYHRFAHQPWTDKRHRPGMTMGAWGTHFERTQTYWPYVGDWLKYQSRCQFLLQEGKFVDHSPRTEPAWTHRRYDDGREAWFVASTSSVPHRIEFAFKPARPEAFLGAVPELWDAEDGSRLIAREWREKGGTWYVTLDFEWRDSIFVMLTPKGCATKATRTANAPAKTLRTFTVDGAWKVKFDPDMGGPAETEFDHLYSWPESTEPGIKYYSGTAVYSKRIKTPQFAPGERLVLDLGRVCDLAAVKVNGKALPVLWKPPFKIEITDFVRGAEEIELEIDVVNLWPNRMIGDAGLPVEKRYSFSVYQPWKATDKLLPSGLIGPVTLNCCK